MELVVDINDRLKEHFGIDTSSGDPIWRVVWSEDQFEHRLGKYDDITPAGIYLRTVTEVRYVPKYRQWLKELYVLERLVAIPVQNAPELPATKLSYEPIFPFWDKNGKYLPPKWEVAKFVIDTIYAAQYSNHNLRKYVDPDGNSQEEFEAAQRKRIDDIMEYLHGEDSAFHDGIQSRETVMLGNNNGR